MAYLHGIKPRSVLHRDLKSSNLLCDQGFNVKICDFGLSRLKAASEAASEAASGLSQSSTRGAHASDAPPSSRVPGSLCSMTGNCGTVQWMAPELLMCGGGHGQPGVATYSETADVYSFAIVLWELIVRKCPYEGQAQVSVAVAVVQEGARPAIPAWCPPKYRALLECCWDQDSKRRPSFKALLRRAPGHQASGGGGSWLQEACLPMEDPALACPPGHPPGTPLNPKPVFSRPGPRALLPPAERAGPAKGGTNPALFRPLSFRGGLVSGGTTANAGAAPDLN
mmetsp:Transcript_18162/g.41531  ORF Transcript_18162/g.41531 Transcript_18162/m.41531 type:complete len:282 (+) Transcript_18162:1494-2339(+)